MLRSQVKEYSDRNLQVPTFMKAAIFKDWFRTKTGAHNEDETQKSEDETNFESISKLINMINDQDDKKLTSDANMDLGTVMIKIFKLIIEATKYG